jgi:hypothetical protein
MQIREFLTTWFGFVYPSLIVIDKDQPKPMLQR